MIILIFLIYIGSIFRREYSFYHENGPDLKVRMNGMFRSSTQKFSGSPLEIFSTGKVFLVIFLEKKKKN